LHQAESVLGRGGRYRIGPQRAKSWSRIALWLQGLN
jgi:hypothetical protein